MSELEVISKCLQVISKCLQVISKCLKWTQFFHPWSWSRSDHSVVWHRAHLTRCCVQIPAETFLKTNSKNRSIGLLNSPAVLGVLHGFDPIGRKKIFRQKMKESLIRANQLRLFRQNKKANIMKTCYFLKG